MANIFSKLLSAGEGKEIKAFRNRVGEINYLEDEISQLSDEDLREKTIEFRERYADGESLEDLLPEAFAVVREASVRTLGLRHFDVQLIGGMVLNEGQDRRDAARAKARRSSPRSPCYLNALPGKGVPHRHRQRLPGHARQRSGWASVYDFLGHDASARSSQNGMNTEAKQRRLCLPTSPTAPTPNSASTTCVTTWSYDVADSRVQRRPLLSPSSTRSTPSSSTRRARRSSSRAPACDSPPTLYAASSRPLVTPRLPRATSTSRWMRSQAGTISTTGQRLSQQRRVAAWHRAITLCPRTSSGQLSNHLHQALQGAVPLPSRQGLRRAERRGHDRRRVHGPHHGRAAAIPKVCTRPSRPRKA